MDGTGLFQVILLELSSDCSALNQMALTVVDLGLCEISKIFHCRLFSRVAPKMGGRMATLERIYPELNWTHMFSASKAENTVEVSLQPSDFTKCIY